MIFLYRKTSLKTQNPSHSLTRKQKKSKSLEKCVRECDSPHTNKQI